MKVSLILNALFRCLHVKGNIGPFKYYFNPLTTVASAVIIWAFVVWCIVLPTESYNEIKTWKIWITEKWTWLYIGTQDVWALFIIVLYFSKYSHLKLGRRLLRLVLFRGFFCCTRTKRSAMFETIIGSFRSTAWVCLVFAYKHWRAWSSRRGVQVGVN